MLTHRWDNLTKCDNCGKPTALKTCKAYILADDLVRVASIAGFAGFPSSVWFLDLVWVVVRHFGLRVVFWIIAFVLGGALCFVGLKG